jgi:hypothetical protein
VEPQDRLGLRGLYGVHCRPSHKREEKLTIVILFNVTFIKLINWHCSQQILLLHLWLLRAGEPGYWLFQGSMPSWLLCYLPVGLTVVNAKLRTKPLTYKAMFFNYKPHNRTKVWGESVICLKPTSNFPRLSVEHTVRGPELRSWVFDIIIYCICLLLFFPKSIWYILQAKYSEARLNYPFNSSLKSLSALSPFLPLIRLQMSRGEWEGPGEQLVPSFQWCFQ